MKAKYLILAAFAIAISAPTAFADVEQAGYIEGFSSSSFNLSSYEGWGRLTETQKTITYSSSSGVTGGSGSYSVGYTNYQNSETKAEPSESAIIYNDLLVSPQLKGDVKFYWKRAYYNASYKSTVKVYRCTKDEDGNFVQGDLLADFSETTTAATGSSWQSAQLSLHVDDYTYLGFRLEYAYIDEVSADYAMMPEKESMSFTAALTETANQAVYKDEEGKVTIHPNIVFTNDGNVVYPSFDCTMTPSFTNGSEQAVTFTVPEIAVGESYTYSEPMSVVAPDPTGTSLYTQFRLNVEANGTTKYTAYVMAYPYKAIPSMRHNGNAYYSSSTVDLDVFQGDLSRELEIKNTGAAPMVISSVDIPEYVDLAILTADKMPYTIEAQQSITEVLTFHGENAGEFEGQLKLNFEDPDMILAPSSTYATEFNFKGVGVPSDVYFVNFDDNKLPEGWYLPSDSKWALTDDPATKLVKGYCYKNSASALTSLQTCKIKFEEGDKLSFDAASQSTSSGELKVQYSTDRTNWVDICDLTNSNSDFGSTVKVYKHFSYEMPEGEYFINFSSGFVYLDNVYGGEAIESAYDVSPISVSVSSNPMVNYPMTVDYTFHNIGAAIAADDYNAVYSDGTVEIKPDKEDIAAGSDFSLSVVYTPHVDGEDISHVLSIVDKDNNEIAKLESIFGVSEEKAQSEVIIGEATAGGAWVPLRPNIKYSSSEMVLAKSIADGDDVKDGLLASLNDSYIEGVRYWYYNTNSAANYSVKIWMEDTDETGVSYDDSNKAVFSSTDNMTLVYENDAYTFEKTASSSTYYPLDFMFSERYSHDPSKNLRIRVDCAAASTTPYMSIGYQSTSSQKITCIYYYSYNTDLSSASSVTVNTSTIHPAMTIISSHDAQYINGNTYLKSEDGSEGSSNTALAEAEITAYNADNDVIYSVKSDADGAYSLGILQPDLDYVISATHHEVVDEDGELQVVVLAEYDYDSESNDFFFSVTTGVNDIVANAEDSAPEYFNLNGVKVSAKNLTPGIYIRRIGNKVQKVLLK